MLDSNLADGLQSSPKSATKRSKKHCQHKSKNRRLMTPLPLQTTVSSGGYGNGQDVIEVQILPQDDNWGENTTVVTGATSDHSRSSEDLRMWGPRRRRDCAGGGGGGGGGAANEPDLSLRTLCFRRLSDAIAAVLVTAAFVSPCAMVVLPQLRFFPALEIANSFGVLQSSKQLICNADCKVQLLTLCFKLVILLFGIWAIYGRRTLATLPRIFLYRSLLLALTFVCIFSHWLFYLLAVTETARSAKSLDELVDYKTLTSYANNLTDTLLFIHYLSVLLLELRHLQPRYYVKVTRSPDGESRCYAIGQLSVQRAASWLLCKYYTQFPIFNPYLERLPVSKSRKNSLGAAAMAAGTSGVATTPASSSFKYYDVDSGLNSNCNSLSQSRTSSFVGAATASANWSGSRRRDSSSHHNERFYEEYEYERRVRKRKARLLTAAEDAFTHIKRLNNGNNGGGLCIVSGGGGGGTGDSQTNAISTPMDAHEAAQAIFPTMARALQKYLRITRQQPRHTFESILEHLSECLRNDLTPKAFLEPYFVCAPVLQHAYERQREQNWALICDTLLSRPIDGHTCFQLRQNDVSLRCEFFEIPRFEIVEEIVDPKSNRFLLKLNSETSV